MEETQLEITPLEAKMKAVPTRFKVKMDTNYNAEIEVGRSHLLTSVIVNRNFNKTRIIDYMNDFVEVLDTFGKYDLATFRAYLGQVNNIHDVLDVIIKDRQDEVKVGFYNITTDHIEKAIASKMGGAAEIERYITLVLLTDLAEEWNMLHPTQVNKEAKIVLKELDHIPTFDNIDARFATTVLNDSINDLRNELKQSYKSFKAGCAKSDKEKLKDLSKNKGYMIKSNFRKFFTDAFMFKMDDITVEAIKIKNLSNAKALLYHFINRSSDQSVNIPELLYPMYENPMLKKMMGIINIFDWAINADISDLPLISNLTELSAERSIIQMMKLIETNDNFQVITKEFLLSKVHTRRINNYDTRIVQGFLCETEMSKSYVPAVIQNVENFPFEYNPHSFQSTISNISAALAPIQMIDRIEEVMQFAALEGKESTEIDISFTNWIGRYQKILAYCACDSMVREFGMSDKAEDEHMLDNSSKWYYQVTFGSDMVKNDLPLEINLPQIVVTSNPTAVMLKMVVNGTDNKLVEVNTVAIEPGSCPGKLKLSKLGFLPFSDKITDVKGLNYKQTTLEIAPDNKDIVYKTAITPIRLIGLHDYTGVSIASNDEFKRQLDELLYIFRDVMKRADLSDTRSDLLWAKFIIKMVEAIDRNTMNHILVSLMASAENKRIASADLLNNPKNLYQIKMFMITASARALNLLSTSNANLFIQKAVKQSISMFFEK